ncbi:MAG: TFIIB-type zinc ribbon-containing protein [Oscillospiraceae bacterium]|jgi:DNA-directed RNA polymerase subunit RPC12/RpoP|nr:TFIIB-type zinc ribbon-containing protein [Oscillospiraceae bacterium]
MAELLQYKCPACGGSVTFDPSAGTLVCPYCGTKLDVSVFNQQETVLQMPTPNADAWKQESAAWTDAAHINIYACQSCGGEVVGDDTLGATSCPYCGNPVVMARQFAGDLKPDLVVPFRQEKAAALDALKKHYKGKPFLPRAFTVQNHLDEIRGLYVPFWLFSSRVDAQMSFKATRVRHWSDAHYDYTETSDYAVRREGSLAFANIPCDGASKMPDDLMDSLEPFDWRGAVDFQSAYLAGFLAERYDVDSRQSAPRANARIENSTGALFQQSVTGFASVMPTGQSIALHHGTVRYGLLPVWMLSTRWKDKTYTFAMNGQTGKFVGDLPVSAGKFLAWFASLSAGIAAVLGLIAWIAGWLA